MIPLPKTPSFRLDGKRALVTGAGRGLGLACASALAEAGAQVVLVSRSEEELRVAAEQIARQHGVSAEFIVLDVTHAQQVADKLGAAGVFDIVVNNAGMNRPRLLVDQPDEDIDAVFDLNVKSAFYVSRAAIKPLLAAGRPGSIINISSQMGLVGSPKRTLYCASKHALEGMTKSLAWELGAHRIRVNTICPTFIETAMTAKMFEDTSFRSWVIDQIALGRLGRVEEVMGAVVFLASDASSLMTGSAVVLDGGWTAA